MARTKEETIEALKSIKNKPIGELKKNPVANSSGTKFKALMQYNAMLDNISLGAHTVTEINYAGIDWSFRLLTAAEWIEIQLEVIASQKKKEIFDDFYHDYLIIRKVLNKASSPNPYKTEGKEIFSEEDLDMIPYDVLEELYLRYIDFIQLACRRVEEFSEDEVQDLIDVVKKKPEILRKYDRSRLLIVSKYLINYSQNLEKIVKSDLTN
jgi:hypothetical protein